MIIVIPGDDRLSSTFFQDFGTFYFSDKGCSARKKDTKHNLFFFNEKSRKTIKAIKNKRKPRKPDKLDNIEKHEKTRKTKTNY